MVLEETEEHGFVGVHYRIDGPVLEEAYRRRVAVNQAAILPDRREAGVGPGDGAGQPVRVIAVLSRSVDEGACKNVLPVHA